MIIINEYQEKGQWPWFPSNINNFTHKCFHRLLDYLLFMTALLLKVFLIFVLLVSFLPIMANKRLSFVPVL